MKLFEILTNLTVTKEDISSHEDFNKDYNPFIVTRLLSMHPSTVHYANFASKMMFQGVSKKMHYLFLLHGIDKKKLYLPFHKKEVVEKDTVNKIGLHFNVNEQRALEIVELLTEPQIETIKRMFGGKKDG